jgi:myo-inositol-1(or 4)-monophosphatase
MADTILDDYTRFAVQLARDAGAVLRDRFGQPHQVRFKGAIDMVTEADQAAEALIAGRLRDAYADHLLLCEEGSRGTALDSRYRWVIDPLDGTTNFAHGLPTFAVSIALEEEGHPIIGVVYDPMRDELFVSYRGGGATLNGESIHVSLTDRLVSSILVTGFSYDFERRALQAEIWRDFLTRVQAIRQTGSAALNLCYIACGRLDGYWERGISPWDVAAGALMVSEAGGTVTDMRGGPFHSDDREILASNGALHADLLDVIVNHRTLSPGNEHLGA